MVKKEKHEEATDTLEEVSDYKKRVSRVAVNRTLDGIAPSLAITNFTPEGYSQTGGINLYVGNDREPMDQERDLEVTLPSLPREMSLPDGQYRSRLKVNYLGYISIEDAVKLVLDTAKTDSTLEEKIKNLSLSVRYSLTELVDEVLKILVLNRQLPYLVPPTDEARPTKDKILIYATERIAEVKGKDGVTSIDEFIVSGVTSCYERMLLQKLEQAIMGYTGHHGTPEQKKELEKKFHVAAKSQEKRRRKSLSPRPLRPVFKFTKANIRKTIKFAAAFLGAAFLIGSSYIGYQYFTSRKLERDYRYGLMARDNAIESAIERHEHHSASTGSHGLGQVEDLHSALVSYFNWLRNGDPKTANILDVWEHLAEGIKYSVDDSVLIAALPFAELQGRESHHLSDFQKRLDQRPDKQLLEGAYHYVNALYFRDSILNNTNPIVEGSERRWGNWTKIWHLILHLGLSKPSAKEKCAQAFYPYFKQGIPNPNSRLDGYASLNDTGNIVDEHFEIPANSTGVDLFFKFICPPEVYLRAKRDQVDEIVRTTKSSYVVGRILREMELHFPSDKATIYVRRQHYGLVSNDSAEKESYLSLEKLAQAFKKEAPIALRAVQQGRVEEYVNDRLDRLNMVLMADAYESLPPPLKKQIIDLEREYIKDTLGITTPQDYFNVLGGDLNQLQGLRDVAQRAMRRVGR